MGAATSSLLTELAKRRGSRSKYVLPLAMEAMLLAILFLRFKAYGPSSETTFGSLLILVGLASFLMGIQNATITNISGYVVRTTHLTGVVTDLGLEGVQYILWRYDLHRSRGWKGINEFWKLSHDHPTVPRLIVLGCILISFLIGSVAGTLAFLHMSYWGLLVPIIFLTYIVVVDIRLPIVDIREIDVFADTELRLHGLLHTMIPAELGIYRLTHLHLDSQHRAPNFQLWIDRLPEPRKLVILVLSSLVRIDRNAVLDLEVALQKLRHGHRGLILAGVTTTQYAALGEMNFLNNIGLENVCPDLEFAIARGLDAIRETKVKNTSARNPHSFLPVG